MFSRTYMPTLMLRFCGLKGVAPKSGGTCHQDHQQTGTYEVLPQIVPHLPHSPLGLFVSLICMIPLTSRADGRWVYVSLCVCAGIHMSCAHI